MKTILNRNIFKLGVPCLLIVLSLIPSAIIRQVVFGLLGFPFAYFINRPPFVYNDMPFITQIGALTVALIWSVIFYSTASIIGWVLKRKEKNENG
jgi:hypothetical protein